jgi:hypothetical protein
MIVFSTIFEDGLSLDAGVGREKIDSWVRPRVLKIATGAKLATGAKRTYRVKSGVKTVRVLTL